MWFQWGFGHAPIADGSFVLYLDPATSYTIPRCAQLRVGSLFVTADGAHLSLPTGTWMCVPALQPYPFAV